MWTLKTLAAMTLSSLAAASAVATERMFVPLGDGNAIAVIDTATDTLVGRIEDVPAAHGLAGTPDGRFLIAGSGRASIPGAAPTRPDGVKAEDHNAHHATQPQSSAGAPATQSTVTVIRQADLAIERRIDVNGPVHHVAASPDSRLAVVTHPARGTVSVIDLTMMRATRELTTGTGANYALFSLNGSQLYVSNAGANTVSVLDTKSWKIVQTFKTGAEPEHMALAPNGRHLYINNVKAGSVTEVFLEYPKKTRELRVGTAPHGIDVSNDNDWIVVAVQGENKVVALNRKRLPSRSMALGPEPYHLAAIRGTGKLYISSAKEPKLWVLDEATLSIQREIQIGGKGHQMVLAPRGDGDISKRKPATGG